MILILFFGFLFGALMQHANLNKYNTIAGMATLEDVTVAKTIAFAIGLGAILVNLEISLGWISWKGRKTINGSIRRWVSPYWLQLFSFPPPLTGWWVPLRPIRTWPDWFFPS